VWEPFIQARLSRTCCVPCLDLLEFPPPRLREAVRLNPNLAQIHGDLADVLSAKGQTGSVADEYRRAIQLNPEAYEAHLSLGQILARAGNMAEARAHIAKAAESPDAEVREAAQKALR